jgi:hypothetical protein
MEIHKQEIVKIASFVTNELGTGETIQFWHDRWWGDETFKDQYPVGGQVCTSNRMLLSKGLFRFRVPYPKTNLGNFTLALMFYMPHTDKLK